MNRSTCALLLLALLAGLAGCSGGGAGAVPHPAAPQGALVAGAPSTRSLVPDPEAAQSSPLPAGAPRHAAAITPALAASISPTAPSDAQVRAELSQMQRLHHSAAKGAPSGTPQIDPVSGAVTRPAGLPVAVAQIFAGGNAIADFPYVYGGGHASFVDSAYDCSASVSYALAAAGLLQAPIVSGDLARWGVPGPGRYVTIFANAGHVFMYVDGVRFDTSGRAGPLGSRWQTAPRSLVGFVVRHPPGL
ncbi:MAG: hypothetical protein ACR2ND_11075 [Solirubrobacteraceae bacterium]